MRQLANKLSSTRNDNQTHDRYAAQVRAPHTLDSDKS